MEARIDGFQRAGLGGKYRGGPEGVDESAAFERLVHAGLQVAQVQCDALIAQAPRRVDQEITAGHVDEIDAAGKSFTHKNADGKMVKNVVTDKTEIKNGDAAAKFEDIKVGDKVSGLRLKKNADGTEYEVVKITKFAAAAAKPAAVEKKDEKKPAKKADKAAAAPAAAAPAAK